MDYPLLNLFLTMLYFFLWIAWLFLLFRIITDIFRSRDLGGGAKAGWMVLILVLPWLGALIYLVVRGTSMHERDAQQARDSQAAVDTWISDKVKAATPAGATGIARLGVVRLGSGWLGSGWLGSGWLGVAGGRCGPVGLAFGRPSGPPLPAGTRWSVGADVLLHPGPHRPVASPLVKIMKRAADC